VRLPVPGADDEAVRTIRRVGDCETVAARSAAGTRVAVVGSGFIGCEAAASLARRGCEVTLLSDEELPQAGRLGTEVGERIAGWLAREGVQLRLGAAIEGFGREAGVLRVDRAVGPSLAVDMVVLGVGVRPRDELARGAGVALGPGQRHVAVDAAMASSAPGLWAVGDIACAAHARAGRAIHVEHWGDALAQGEIAGRRLAGDGSVRWEAVPGFWSTIGDRTVKYAAWGDGHDDARLTEADGGAFTVRYLRDGRLVGVLTHGEDDDYERGRSAIARGERAP
jgi:NADPH-dependent 2,4-dienoyl-CoA reductase/sulfur reductase-like enzyme